MTGVRVWISGANDIVTCLSLNRKTGYLEVDIVIEFWLDVALYDPVKQQVESFNNPVKELVEKEYFGDPSS